MNNDENRLDGTWELDLPNSSFTPGPAPQRVRYTIRATAWQLHMTTERWDAAGNYIRYQYEAGIDGQVYPVAAPHADGVIWQRYGQDRYRTTILKDGRVLMEGDLVMADDGEELTANYAGPAVDGQPIVNRLLVRRVD